LSIIAAITQRLSDCRTEQTTATERKDEADKADNPVSNAPVNSQNRQPAARVNLKKTPQPDLASKAAPAAAATKDERQARLEALRSQGTSKASEAPASEQGREAAGPPLAEPGQE